MDGMTTQRYERIPEWTLGDRLRKARELTGLGQRDFASEIGVSHQTVTNAEKGHRAVRTITLNAWAMRTGVDREWLETGVPSGDPGGDGGRRTRVGLDSGDPSTTQEYVPHLVAA